MSSRLPERVNPQRIAEHGAQLVGKLPLLRMTRLASLLADDVGEVSVALRFDVDGQRRPVVDGEVDATVVMQCQRCMEALSLHVVRDVRLTVVAAEGMLDQVARDRDPLLIADGDLDIVGLVEDELLLALPQVPMHAQGECGRSGYRWTSGEQEGIRAEEGASPFAVLSRLKQDT